MSRRAWYRSLYWRIGAGFVVFLALVAAAQAGAQTVTGVQELIGAGWGPRRGARGGNLDFAFDGQQNRFDFVRAFRGRGLGAQIAPQQEREKKPPDSWKQVSHEDLFQHRDRFAALKSANKITNVAKSTLGANGQSGARLSQNCND